MKLRIYHILLLLLFSNYLFSQEFIAGETYFGDHDYIEYKAGSLPIIISAPHGGSILPDNIPDRNCSGCVYVQDAYTENLIRQIYNAIYEEIGCYPHIIINRLHRKKLDANRDIEEAADGNPIAEKAWHDYHKFIQIARDTLLKQYGKGIYIDLHGHGHSIQRLELGYLLNKSNLQLPDATLNGNDYIQKASIKNLVFNNISNSGFSDLIRGDKSLGEMFEQEGFPAVPSLTQPYPKDNEKYFTGGYNTKRYGSNNGGTIDAVQIECNRKGVRDSYNNREAFSKSIAKILKEYLETHYFGEEFISNNCSLMLTDDIVEPPAIKLFPVPVANRLNIVLNRKVNSTYNITIYNDLGGPVFNGVYSHYRFTILVDFLPKGIFLLNIRSSKTYRTIKFIKLYEK